MADFDSIDQTGTLQVGSASKFKTPPEAKARGTFAPDISNVRLESPPPPLD